MAPDRTVPSLDQIECLCSTMICVSPHHLLWTLEGPAEGVVHNRIVRPDETKRWTKEAPDRMLSIA
jgi:quinolinate synthase